MVNDLSADGVAPGLEVELPAVVAEPAAGVWGRGVVAGAQGPHAEATAGSGLQWRAAGGLAVETGSVSVVAAAAAAAVAAVAGVVVAAAAVAGTVAAAAAAP